MNAVTEPRAAAPVIETRGLRKVYSEGTEAEVVAEIRAFVSRMPELPEGPKALDKAMARAVKAKGKKKPEPERATATEHLQFLADAVNGDRFLPQTMITMSKARELIRAGLVTEQRMRERGVLF